MTENRLFFRFVNFLKAINCWKVSLVYSKGFFRQNMRVLTFRLRPAILDIFCRFDFRLLKGSRTIILLKLVKLITQKHHSEFRVKCVYKIWDFSF